MKTIKVFTFSSHTPRVILSTKFWKSAPWACNTVATCSPVPFTFIPPEPHPWHLVQISCPGLHSQHCGPALYAWESLEHFVPFSPARRLPLPDSLTSLSHLLPNPLLSQILVSPPSPRSKIPNKLDLTEESLFPSALRQFGSTRKSRWRHRNQPQHLFTGDFKLSSSPGLLTSESQAFSCLRSAPFPFTLSLRFQTGTPSPVYFQEPGRQASSIHSSIYRAPTPCRY